jgi:hypothetical protein
MGVFVRYAGHAGGAVGGYAGGKIGGKIGGSYGAALGTKAGHYLGKKAAKAGARAAKAGVQKVIASLKKGGRIRKTGLYRLHKGERVIPKCGCKRKKHDPCKCKKHR